MSRSKWKMQPINIENLTQQTNNRTFTILPAHIDKTIEVYNGLKYIKITITKDMIGHKLGEYAATRSKNIIKKK